MRTSNAIDVVNRKTRRRTRVAKLFANEASYLPPVTAVAMEISKDWQSGRRYLNMNDNDNDNDNERPITPTPGWRICRKGVA